MSKQAAEGPRIEWMEIGDIRDRFDKRNTKKHDHEEIKASIRRRGFVSPAIVNETTGKLSAGHGRTESLLMLRAAGENAPKGVRVERGKRWLVPVVRGQSLAAGHDVEYLLADNRLVELGGWDNDATMALLREMDEAALSGIGWDASDLLERDERVQQQGRVKYGIRIECKSEAQRDKLIARLERQGFACTPVTSAPRARKMR